MTFIAESFEEKIMKQLKLHESYRRFPYLCTVGYGRNLDDKGISRKEAEYLLKNDIAECETDLIKIFSKTYDLIPSNAWLVFVDLRFNLGPKGFRSFKNMIKKAERQDWPGVAAEIKDSKWFNQAGQRAKTLINMINSI